MSNIKVGDLVMVVKPKPCGCSEKLGAIFVVSTKRNTTPKVTCSSCLKSRESLDTDKSLFGYFEDICCLEREVIKIEPPKESETIKTNKELETNE